MRPEEPVARIMTETVVVIEVDRPVSEALDCFLQYPIHHLPVVRNNRLVGMLSSADLIKLEYFAPRGQATAQPSSMDGSASSRSCGRRSRAAGPPPASKKWRT